MIYCEGCDNDPCYCRRDFAGFVTFIIDDKYENVILKTSPSKAVAFKVESQDIEFFKTALANATPIRVSSLDAWIGDYDGIHYKFDNEQSQYKVISEKKLEYKIGDSKFLLPKKKYPLGRLYNVSGNVEWIDDETIEKNVLRKRYAEIINEEQKMKLAVWNATIDQLNKCMGAGKVISLDYLKPRNYPGDHKLETSKATTVIVKDEKNLL